MGFWKKQNHQLQNTAEHQRTGRPSSSHVTTNADGSGDPQARSPTVNATSNRKNRSTSNPPKSGQSIIQQPNIRSASVETRDRHVEASGNNAIQQVQPPSNRAPPASSPQPKQSRHQQQRQPGQEQRIQQQQQQQQQRQPGQEQRIQQQQQQQQQRLQQQQRTQQHRVQQTQQQGHPQSKQLKQTQQAQHPRQEHRQQHGQNQLEHQHQRQQVLNPQQQRQKQPQEHAPKNHPQGRQVQQQEQQQRQQPSSQPHQLRQKQMQDQRQQAKVPQQQQRQNLHDQQQHRQQHQQRPPPPQSQQQRQQPLLEQFGAQALRQSERRSQTVATASSSGVKHLQQEPPQKSSGAQQQSVQSPKPTTNSSEQPSMAKQQKRDHSPHTHQQKHVAVHNQRQQPGQSSLVATANSQMYQQSASAHQQQHSQTMPNSQRQHVAVKKSQGSASNPEKTRKISPSSSVGVHPKSSSVAQHPKSQGLQSQGQQEATARSPSLHPKVAGQRVASTSPIRSDHNQLGQPQVPIGQFVAVSVSKYNTHKSGPLDSNIQPKSAQAEQSGQQQKQLRTDTSASHTRTLPQQTVVTAKVSNTVQNTHANTGTSSSTLTNTRSLEIPRNQPNEGSGNANTSVSLPLELNLRSPSGAEGTEKAKEGSSAIKEPKVVSTPPLGLVPESKHLVSNASASSLSGLSENSGAPSKKSVSSDNQSVSGNVVMLSLDADGVRSSGRSTLSVKMDSSNASNLGSDKPSTSARTSELSGVTSLHVPSASYKAAELAEHGIGPISHPKTVAVAQSDVISVPVPHFGELKGIHSLAFHKAEVKAQPVPSIVQNTSAQQSSTASYASPSQSGVSSRNDSNTILMSLSSSNTIQTFVTSVPKTALVAQAPDSSSSKTVALVSANPSPSTAPASASAASSSSNSAVVTVATKTGVTSQPALFVVPKTAAVSLATVHKKVETSSIIYTSTEPKVVSISGPSVGSKEGTKSSETDAKTSVTSNVPQNTHPSSSVTVSVGNELKVPTETANKGATIAVVAVTKPGIQSSAVSASSSAARDGAQPIIPKNTPVNASSTASALARTSAQLALGAAVKVNGAPGLGNVSDTHSNTGSKTNVTASNMAVTSSTSNSQAQSEVSMPSSTTVTESNQKTSKDNKSPVSSITAPPSSVAVTVVSVQNPAASAITTSPQQTQAVTATSPSSSHSTTVARNDTTRRSTVGKFQLKSSASLPSGNASRPQAVASSSSSAVTSQVQTTPTRTTTTNNNKPAGKTTRSQASAQPTRSVAVSSSTSTPSIQISEVPSLPIVREDLLRMSGRSQPYERIHSQTLVTSFSGGAPAPPAPKPDGKVTSESSGTGRPQTGAVPQGSSNGQRPQPSTSQDGASRPAAAIPQSLASQQQTSSVRQEALNRTLPQNASRAVPGSSQMNGTASRQTVTGLSQLSGTPLRQTVAVAQSNSPRLNTTRQPSRPAPTQPQSNARDQERSASSVQPSQNTNSNQQHNRTLDPSDLQIDVLNSQTRQLDLPEIHTTGLSAGVVAPRPSRQEALPDILNSHVQPQGPRQNRSRLGRQETNHYREAAPPGMTQLEDDEKRCCTRAGCLCCITEVTRFRWVLVFLALLGVTCVIIGTVLGALHMTGNTSYLTLSLMFIGLGVVLVIVVGVAWKCTPTGHEPCHMLFSLGSHMTESVSTSPSRRTNNRNGRNRSNWNGGILYPEFRYRRPPPSYNASMQDYQQQLMLAQMQLNEPDTGGQDNYSLPSSPPPTYKSRASTIRPGLHITFPPNQSDQPNSRPPTYRSSRNSERPSLPMVPSQQEDHPSSRVLEYLQGVLQNSPQRQISQQSLSQPNPSQSSQSVAQSSQINQAHDSNQANQGHAAHTQHSNDQSQFSQNASNRNNSNTNAQSDRDNLNSHTGNSSGRQTVGNTQEFSDTDHDRIADIEAIADTPL